MSMRSRRGFFLIRQIPRHVAYLEEALSFFGEMSRALSDYENVLYEICNEPNRNVTWNGNVKPYAEKIIPVIRANSNGIDELYVFQPNCRNTNFPLSVSSLSLISGVKLRTVSIRRAAMETCRKTRNMMQQKKNRQKMRPC